jgi:hypothetical protein
MKKVSLYLACSALPFLVAGCGSSSNDSAPPPPAGTVQLTAGNVDVTARAAANAALGSASLADITPVSAASTKEVPVKVATVKARSLQQVLLGLTRNVVFERAMAKAAPVSGGLVRAQGVITETEACDAGGTVVGVLDDRDNSNSVSSGDQLSVTFNQCRPNATDFVNGSISASFSVVQDSPGFASAIATVTYTQLQATSTEGDFSINGSFSFSFSRLNNVDTAQFSIGVNGLTASVTDSNYSDTVTLHAGYTVTATRDPSALPPGSSIPGVGTLSVNGAISANSIGGTIVLSTPVAIRQFDIDAYPREGQLQVRGANNGMLVLTVLSTSTVRVQLDGNGDGTFEVPKDVAWVDLV